MRNLKKQDVTSPGLRPQVRRFLWGSVWLYWPIALVRLRKNICNRQYDLLVEGFPRSANTYIALAIKYCAPVGFRLESHLHCPPAVLAAMRVERPVLLLYREPRNVIVSWVLASRYPVRYVIESYCDYYEILEPYWDRLGIAEFKDITSETKGMIRGIGARFGIVFQEEHLKRLTESRVLDDIEESFRAMNGSVDEFRVSRPSSDRDRLRGSILTAIEDPENCAALSRAEAIYRRLNAHASRIRPIR